MEEREGNHLLLECQPEITTVDSEEFTRKGYIANLD